MDKTEETPLEWSGRLSPLPRGPTRIVRRKVSGEVIEHLVVQLFDGHLRSGDRLDLAAIASSLGVSQAPVREAVLVLEREGVLITVYHRGVFVAPFSHESLLESFELYGALSGLAASNVARVQDPQVISALDRVVREGRKATSDEYAARLHREFRNILHHSGASLRVRNLLRNFSGILPTAGSIPSHSPRERTADLQRMFRPIKSGDEEAAAQAVYDSTYRAGMRVIRVLEERGVFEPRDLSPSSSVTPDSHARSLFMELLTSPPT